MRIYSVGHDQYFLIFIAQLFIPELEKLHTAQLWSQSNLVTPLVGSYSTFNSIKVYCDCKFFGSKLI